MLRALYRDADRIMRESARHNHVMVDPMITDEERDTALLLVSNLRAVVLDEADQLLRTEAVAREAAERKRRKITERKAMAEAEAASVNRLPPPRAKKQRLDMACQTQTELLLRDLPIPSLSILQVICAYVS